MAQQERAIRTRRVIVVAAAEVFAEVGYEAATIVGILNRAGVTKGALYFHFSSKQELAQAVLAGRLSATPRTPPRGLKLQQGLDELFLLAHLLREGDPLVRGSVRLAVEQGALHDGLDRRVPMAEWIERKTVTLAEAKQNGELLPHVEVGEAARMLIGAFTGVQELSRVMTGHADLMERVADLQRHLMPSIAVPAVLVQLDMTVDRGERVCRESRQQRLAADVTGAAE
ncbi:TetR/AcrR family transcriptional regulator [Streptomyces pluripotens]|uniref:TetR/AcrR family transcriptional regulator n=1 Tax=Streptomyces pluripotens TaxID=1355015 RepID=A0A221P6W7_9ACTN|nr:MULTISPECIES: ScbR family autoregulator-binding transcription factor [Streptomyces]ARP73710.1 TetR family transcriptional regulator [Streptomyces pluripotens]ASN27957.1 TetR/AcrR family transcriptional regulator [Streptomyces pluripotens]KIE24329.1 gamma-butyrolactone receptor protein [Streptomyces sp. MUSC 125]MCH0559429.1 TetR/AcrR family transcriptional regulator [Streptomyces sp. MUM 16J]